MTALVALIQFSVYCFQYINKTRERTLKFDKHLWQSCKAQKPSYKKKTVVFYMSLINFHKKSQFTIALTYVEISLTKEL